MLNVLDSRDGGATKQSLCVCNLASPPPIDTGVIELGFISRQSPLWYRRFPDNLAVKTIDFLSHRISKNPQDLNSHVQRVVACYYYSGSADSLYGALLDLFLVLGEKGQALRKRMLDKFEAYLKEEHRQVLSEGLERGIRADDDMPQSPISYLAKLSAAKLRLVEKTSAEVVTVDFNALDEARDLIDSGFIEEAQMMLDEILSNRPGCEETSKELLDLYKYTKNKDAFFAVKARLDALEQEVALRDEWEALAQKFLEEEERVGNE